MRSVFDNTAAARGPAGAYSCAGVGPNRPSVGAPAAAARCIRPESLPTNSAHRARHAAASGSVSLPTRSIGFRQGSEKRGGHRSFRLAGPGEDDRDRARQRAGDQRVEQRGVAFGGPDLRRPVGGWPEADQRAARRQQRSSARAILGRRPHHRQRRRIEAQHRPKLGDLVAGAVVASPRVCAPAPSTQAPNRGCPPQGPRVSSRRRPRAAASAGCRGACRARWCARGSACARTHPRPRGRRRR